ncbi:MAG: hypothetical protein JNK87_07460 [Bryobacterales bacterium]|nr:hypothetical protein [Bryobacterales bacterium]
MQDAGTDEIELVRLQDTGLTDGAAYGIGGNVPGQECAAFEWDGDNDLVGRAAQGGGVWDHGDERTVLIPVDYAQDQRWTHFLGQSDL